MPKLRHNAVGKVVNRSYTHRTIGSALARTGSLYLATRICPVFLFSALYLMFATWPLMPAPGNVELTITASPGNGANVHAHIVKVRRHVHTAERMLIVLPPCEKEAVPDKEHFPISSPVPVRCASLRGFLYSILSDKAPPQL